MRWALITLESLAAGVFAILVSLVAVVIGLNLWARYMLGLGPRQAVGLDPISLIGPHWKLALLGIPVAIFVFGFSAGFWFFSKRLHT